MKDNISDMLTRIRNGQKANLLEVPLFWPTPNFCIDLLTLFQREGYIRGFNKKIINNKEYFTILLKYTDQNRPLIQKIIRISKPGKRIYSTGKTVWKVNNGKGIYIFSTPYGLMTDNNARHYNIGGEIICYIE
jgi:small subunit ribosomal protein S8